MIARAMPGVPSRMRFHVTVRADTLTLERTVDNAIGTRTDTTRFALGGEMRDTIGGAALPRLRTTSARWAGDTLVLENAMQMDGSGVVTTERWTADADGRTLRSAVTIRAGDEGNALAFELHREGPNADRPGPPKGDAGPARRRVGATSSRSRAA
jgi:hypothetical protein